MARIQILELPTQVVSDYVNTPFAIVIDQVETEASEIREATGDVVRLETVSEFDQDAADAAARAIGAVGAILTTITLDVA